MPRPYDGTGTPQDNTHDIGDDPAPWDLREDTIMGDPNAELLGLSGEGAVQRGPTAGAMAGQGSTAPPGRGVTTGITGTPAAFINRPYQVTGTQGPQGQGQYRGEQARTPGVWWQDNLPGINPWQTPGGAGFGVPGTERRGEHHDMTPMDLERRIQNHINPEGTGGGYERDGGRTMQGGGYGPPAAVNPQVFHQPRQAYNEVGEEEKEEIEPNRGNATAATRGGHPRAQENGTVLKALTLLMDSIKDSPERVRREYTWQYNILEDKGKDEFKSMLLSSPRIQTIAVLPKDQPAPVVKVLHSLAVYYSMEEDAPAEVQGKTIGFMGERTATKEPVPVFQKT